MTLHGDIKGTPGFMAPEQADTTNAVRDQRTDIYALGGILYFLLTCRAPIAGKTLSELLTNTTEGKIIAPNSVCQVPRALEAVFYKALSLQPDDRYQSVEELKSEIEAYINGFATAAEEAGIIKMLFLEFNSLNKK